MSFGLSGFGGGLDDEFGSYNQQDGTSLRSPSNVTLHPAALPRAVSPRASSPRSPPTLPPARFTNRSPTNLFQAKSPRFFQGRQPVGTVQQPPVNQTVRRQPIRTFQQPPNYQRTQPQPVELPQLGASVPADRSSTGSGANAGSGIPPRNPHLHSTNGQSIADIVRERCRNDAPVDDDDDDEGTRRSCSLFSLRDYAYTYKGWLTFGLVSSVLNKIFDLAPPLLVGWAIDTMDGNTPSFIEEFVDPTDGTEVAVFFGIFIFVIFFFESLFQYFYQLAFMVTAQNVQHDVRTDLYDHLQKLPMSFFTHHRLGDTLSRLIEDTNLIEKFLNEGLNDVVQLITLFGFVGVVAFWVHWPLALVSVIPIPLVVGSSLYYHSIVQPRYHKVRTANGLLSSLVENSVSGIVTVKAFSTEKFERKRVVEASSAYRDRLVEAVKLFALYVPLVRNIIALAYGLVIALATYSFIDGKELGGISLTTGDVALFSALSQRLLWPMTRLGQLLDSLQRSNAAADRAIELLLLDPEPVTLKGNALEAPKDASGTVVVPSSEDSKDSQEKWTSAIYRKGWGGSRNPPGLEFQNVHFRYPNPKNYLLVNNSSDKDELDEDDSKSRPPILKGLSFKIKPGEFIGIAGATGAGKSTLMKLLMRLYNLDAQVDRTLAGEVKLGGVDVQEIPLSTLRSKFALVPQHPYVFHGTIRENIQYGASEADRKSMEADGEDADGEDADGVLRVSKMAQLHDFVNSLPKKYETLVGERGIRLSGGQLQRLAIARALLKNAPVLILDEATSSVDTETEQLIQEKLTEFIRGKTALVVAHRLSTIAGADRILVLEKGQLVEQGSHEALLQREGGVYRKLWSVQSGAVARAS